MTNDAIAYLTDTQGHPNAVVIPMALWRQIFPEPVDSVENIVEGIEDYCLSRAMDEAVKTPLLDREAALELLEEESD